MNVEAEKGGPHDGNGLGQAFPSIASAARSVADSLSTYARPQWANALVALLCDLAVYAFGVVLAVTQPKLMALGGSLLMSVAMIRLFILGHDACHQALTSSRALNAIVGRIAFLPTLTPYSYWEIGHNVLHHGFTNLKGRDYVWAPMSPEEFLQASRARQLLERVYRSAVGHGLYYLCELWWRRLFLPNRKYVSVVRPMFGIDTALVVAFGITWIGGSIIAGSLLSSMHGAAFFAVVLPFVVWNYVMGVVIFVHHTHPEIAWHNDVLAWSKARRQCPSTAHLAVPNAADQLLRGILQHPVHHMRVDIPFHRLTEAQRSIAATPSAVFVRTSLRQIPNTVRTCKLFDFSSMKWVPFPNRQVPRIMSTVP